MKIKATIEKVPGGMMVIPLIQAAISSNSKGVINQNFGYDGYSNNATPLKSIDPKDDN